MNPRTLFALMALAVGAVVIGVVLAHPQKADTKRSAEDADSGRMALAAVEPPVEEVPPPDGISRGDALIIPRLIAYPSVQKAERNGPPCLMFPGAGLAVTGFTPMDGDSESALLVEYQRVPLERPSEAMYTSGIMAKECKDKAVYLMRTSYYRELWSHTPEIPTVLCAPPATRGKEE